MEKSIILLFLYTMEGEDVVISVKDLFFDFFR